MNPPTAVSQAPARQPIARRASAPSRLGRWVPWPAAALAGFGCFLAFPPAGLWLLAPVSVCALTALTARRRVLVATGLAAVFGAALFVPLLVWIRPLGSDVWLALALAEAALLAPVGAGTALLRRLPGWPVWVACLWVADESVRARVPLGGFPWGRLGFSQAGGPLAGYAAVGGIPLVSFAVALAGTLLAAGVATAPATGRRRMRPAAGWLAGAAAVVLAVLAVPLPTAGQSRGGPAYAQVAVVQGNVPRMGLDAFAQRYTVIRNHVEATEGFGHQVRAGQRPRPDIVLWPENSTDVDPDSDQLVGALIAEAVQSVGAPTLVGAVLDGPGPHHVRNAGLVWPPGEPPHVGYVKRQLVPFGEYVPYRKELGHLIGRLRRVPYDFVPGHASGVVQLGPVRLSDVICYEVAYDGLVRGDVRDGGRLIVVQTNNATYGHTETEQQLAMGRLRAIEHGRAVAVAATSGISAVIAPDGRVLSRSRVFTQAVLDQRVPLRDSRTIADRVTGWPELVLAATALAALVAALVLAWTAGDRRRGRDAV